MGFHNDEIHFCLDRIRHHLHLFLAQNPVACGVSIFLSFLYVFLPWVFRLLLHSFPVFVMIVLAVKFSLDRKLGKVADESEPQESNCLPESPMCGSGSGEKSYKRAHSVRRRNAKLTAISQEKDAAAAAAAAGTTSGDDVVIDKVVALIEEDNNPKEIREVKREMMVPVRGRVEILKRVNKEEEEEEEEDELDDEKKSMDIAGLSEAERNTRLESLMAKRKARKMLSVQLRKALVKMGKNDPRAQFASILIPKSIPNVPTSPTPGCAPCVLFPTQTRNPFDIPYDSHEEKPNLSEDGFQKEFVANQSKNSVTLTRAVGDDHDTKTMLPNIPINESSNVTNPQEDLIKDAIFITSPTSSTSLKEIETIPNKDDDADENISIPCPQPPTDLNNNIKGNEEGLFSASRDSDSQAEVSGMITGHPDHEKALDVHGVCTDEDEGSREVHELREQDIMDVVFSGLEPIYEPDIEESESLMGSGSISMINHDHQTDKSTSSTEEQLRKGKSIVEDNNNTYEADDIPNNNGKEIIDYIKDTYDEQPSYEPSSSSSSINKNNEFPEHRSDHVNEIDQQKEYNPFSASSSHSEIIENETSIANINDEKQPDLQQEMLVGEGAYDSSSSSTTSRSSSFHDKIIQTDQDSSSFDKPTNENIPKSDHQSEIQLGEINVTPTSQSSTANGFNLQIGSGGQTSTQETIPCSTDKIEADSDEMNHKEI